ncbi:MAG: STAS domain-containing protein [Pseudomonadota bacterium]|jgi:anti-anti-sigma factor|nr:STAS domain-containing protein [Desulfobacterales bacterium]MBL6968586.1 STAS domain-containing protein [Desulfobacteraceae bacterium]MBL7171956.1 STAS domain-containing protein [Desulfobacteraceae bacterium]MBU0736303.1 STAS domain-containing protein [Pseudomonadota bacterium]
MKITNTGKNKDCLIVTVEGRMDAVTAPEFERCLKEWIDEGETLFIVDFGGLDYISSAGLRSILTIAKSLKLKKGQIALSALRSTVKEVFEISGFSTIIPVFESVEAALKEI